MRNRDKLILFIVIYLLSLILQLCNSTEETHHILVSQNKYKQEHLALTKLTSLLLKGILMFSETAESWEWCRWSSWCCCWLWMLSCECWWLRIWWSDSPPFESLAVEASGWCAFLLKNYKEQQFIKKKSNLIVINVEKNIWFMNNHNFCYCHAAVILFFILAKI